MKVEPTKSTDELLVFCLPEMFLWHSFARQPVPALRVVALLRRFACRGIFSGRPRSLTRTMPSACWAAAPSVSCTRPKTFDKQRHSATLWLSRRCLFRQNCDSRPLWLKQVSRRGAERVRVVDHYFSFGLSISQAWSTRGRHQEGQQISVEAAPHVCISLRGLPGQEVQEPRAADHEGCATTRLRTEVI